MDPKPDLQTRPALNRDSPRKTNVRGQSAPDHVEACCDRCGSVRLIRVKACWRCDACGYKSDCNGW